MKRVKQMEQRGRDSSLPSTNIGLLSIYYIPNLELQPQVKQTQFLLSCLLQPKGLFVV